MLSLKKWRSCENILPTVIGQEPSKVPLNMSRNNNPLRTCPPHSPTTYVQEQLLPPRTFRAGAMTWP